MLYNFFFQKAITEFFKPLKVKDVKVPKNAKRRPIGEDVDLNINQWKFSCLECRRHVLSENYLSNTSDK